MKSKNKMLEEVNSSKGPSVFIALLIQQAGACFFLQEQE